MKRKTVPSPLDRLEGRSRRGSPLGEEDVLRRHHLGKGLGLRVLNNHRAPRRQRAKMSQLEKTTGVRISQGDAPLEDLQLEKLVSGSTEQ